MPQFENMTDTPYYELPLLGFDIESTGIDVTSDRVVTFNITYSFSDDMSNKETHDWVIDPGMEIPEGASAVHGVSTEYAQAHGMDPREALILIHEHLFAWESQGLPLVAFNAAYDCSMLYYEWKRHGIEQKVSFNRVIDPFVIDKHLNPYRKKGQGTLGALSKFYMVDLENAHSADADVLATLGIARNMPHAIPRSKLDLSMPLDKLHALQVQWKRDQAASFQKYLREKRGEKDAVINGQWPVQSD